MRSKEEIRRIVEGFARSGMTRREYCAKHGVAMTTLDYWRRAHRKQKPRLVEVAIEEAQVPAGFTLVLVNGRGSLPVKLVAQRGMERTLQKPELDRWDKATRDAILRDHLHAEQQPALFGDGPQLPAAIRRRLDEHRKRVDLQRAILDRRVAFEDASVESLGVLLRVPASLVEGAT